MEIPKKEIKETVSKLILNDILINSEEIFFFEDNNFYKLIKTEIERKNFSEIKKKISEYKTKKEQEKKLKKIGGKITNKSKFFKKITSPDDFIESLRKEYIWFKKEFIRKYLLKDIVSINKLNFKKQHEEVEIISYIQSISKTKNNHYILIVEDLTGEIKTLINKENKKLIETIKDLSEEDFVYIKGNLGNNIIFAEEIKFLDYKKEAQKEKIKKKMVFISDLHIGSRNFCEKEFMKAINWINQSFSQTNQSKNTVIFILGDIVDGVGIFKEQKKELTIKKLKDQYSKAAEILSKINKDLPIILIPGNHDDLENIEPQETLDLEAAVELYKMKNLIILPNPSFLVFNEENVQFKLFLYHGQSFDYFVQNNEKIRLNGGYKKVDLLMDLLLKKRRISNTKSSRLNPQNRKSLIIKEEPDVFVTGHTHTTKISKKQGVMILNPGTFQSQTSFQKEQNILPDECKLILLEPNSEKIKIINFKN
jgi:DNA polymerase II small subunit